METSSVARRGTAEIEQQHYDFLKSLPGPEQWAVKYLYDRLNILDSKAGALMRSNGMIIGFLGAIVAGLLREGVSQWKQVPLLIGGIVIFGLLAKAELLSFKIFALKFDRASNPTDFAEYRRRFFQITMEREDELSKALRWSRLGTVGFILLFVVLAIGELLLALDGIIQPRPPSS